MARRTGTLAALDAVRDVALSTHSLTDAGLTAEQGSDLSRLLLTIIRATQETRLDGFAE